MKIKVKYDPILHALREEDTGGGSGGSIDDAIPLNKPFSTTVGGYTVALTSGGGLAVSGSGASVVLSGGQIAASVPSEDGEGETGIAVGPSGTVLHYSDVTQMYHMSFGANGIAIDHDESSPVPNVEITGSAVATKPWADSRFARPLVTSTNYNLDDPLEPTANIGVLDGGVNYVYTVPLYQVNVTSVPRTTDASYLHFTLDSVTAPTPVVISGVSYLNEAVFSGGKEYLLRFFDGMLETHEVMSEPEKPVDGSTGAWYKSGAAVRASGMTLSNVAVSGGETLNVYTRGVASGATVYSGGTMYISSGGVGYDVLAAEAGGRTSVYAGGVLSGVTLSGGPVTVAAGGYVDGAHVHFGNLGVVGTATNAVLYSGENFRLYPGGFASDATIMGGVCYVSSGASATGFTISGGVCAPIPGASMTDVTIRGGQQYVSGVVSGIILSGGTLRMFTGGSALAVTSLGGSVISAEGSYIEYVTE